MEARIRFFRLLQTKTATAVCLSLAFVARMIMHLCFYSLSGDRSLQAVAAKNLANGNGYTIDTVSATNILESVYTPLTGWPPGYSLLLSAIYFLTHNMLFSILFLDGLCILMLLYFSRKILRTIGCSVALSNAYTLMQGFFLYDFVREPSTDLNALAFLIASISLTLSLLQNKNASVGQAVLLAVVNFFVPFIRYMYIPIALVLPSYLLFGLQKSEHKTIHRLGKITLSISLVLLAGLLFFQKTYTGSATYVYPFPVGFHPENLLRIYPFTLTPFFDIVFYSTLAAKAGIMEYGKYHNLLIYLNGIFFCALLYYGIRFFFKKQEEETSAAEHYLFNGTIISIIIILLLVALSLRYAGIPAFRYWTYVQESRYWAFITFLLQQLIFIFIYHKWGSIKGWWWRAAGWALGLLMLFETLHGAYFTTKKALIGIPVLQQGADAVEKLGPMKQLAERVHQLYPSKMVVFASNENDFLNPLRLLGEKTVVGNNIFEPLLQEPHDKIVVYLLYKFHNKHLISLAEQNDKLYDVTENGYLKVYSTHLLR